MLRSTRCEGGRWKGKIGGWLIGGALGEGPRGLGQGQNQAAPQPFHAVHRLLPPATDNLPD